MNDITVSIGLSEIEAREFVNTTIPEVRDRFYRLAFEKLQEVIPEPKPKPKPEYKVGQLADLVFPDGKRRRVIWVSGGYWLCPSFPMPGDPVWDPHTVELVKTLGPDEVAVKKVVYLDGAGSPVSGHVFRDQAPEHRGTVVSLLCDAYADALEKES